VRRRPPQGARATSPEATGQYRAQAGARGIFAPSRTGDTPAFVSETTETSFAPDVRRGALPVSAAGLVLGAVFFTASLTPSLLPRDPVTQGILAGVLAAIGHEIGAAAAWLWRFMGVPQPGRARQRLTVGLALPAVAAICGYGLARAPDWQNATRRVMELAPVEATHPLTIATTASAIFLLLFLFVRLFIFAVRRAETALGRVLPKRVGRVLGVALVGWAFWALIDGVLLRRALEAADASFEAADMLIDPDLPRPEGADVTGSAASLLSWERIGRWGRTFVATTPTEAEIAEFAGAGATRPVRVYVGRRSAPTPEARAALALEELIRQDGFDRRALVVAVPVGTGWMDPGAHDPLEFMLGGDVATVAVQYSYLTSPLALWMQPRYGITQARALFDAVYDHWSELPEDDRPELYLHGISQGALNLQSALPLLDIIGDPIDGAVWAGSPFLSPLWQQVREGRNPDSPVWRPRFGNGSLVRVANQWGGLDRFAAPWGPTRLVFLHYGSDPIVHFSFDSAFRRPRWMAEPRPPDVAPEFQWFPIVTMFQLAMDMAVSARVPGYGHFYVARDYIDAWAAVADPPGWSESRAERLKAIFEDRPRRYY